VARVADLVLGAVCDEAGLVPQPAGARLTIASSSHSRFRSNNLADLKFVPSLDSSPLLTKVDLKGKRILRKLAARATTWCDGPARGD
jgi:hypothetical protein